METPPPAPRPKHHNILYPDCLSATYKAKLNHVLPKLKYLSNTLSPERNVLGGSIAIVLHILGTNLSDENKCRLIELVINPDPEKNTNVDFYIGHAENEEYLNLLKKFNVLKISNASRKKMNSAQFNFNGYGNKITVDLFANENNNGKFNQNDVHNIILDGYQFRILNIEKLLRIYTNLEGKRVSKIKKQFDKQKIDVLDELLKYMDNMKRRKRKVNNSNNNNSNNKPCEKTSRLLFGGNLYLNVGKFGKRKIRMQKNKKLYIILNKKKYKLPF